MSKELERIDKIGSGKESEAAELCGQCLHQSILCFMAFLEGREDSSVEARATASSALLSPPRLLSQLSRDWEACIAMDPMNSPLQHMANGDGLVYHLRFPFPSFFHLADIIWTGVQYLKNFCLYPRWILLRNVAGAEHTRDCARAIRAGVCSLHTARKACATGRREIVECGRRGVRDESQDQRLERCLDSVSRRLFDDDPPQQGWGKEGI